MSEHSPLPWHMVNLVGIPLPIVADANDADLVTMISHAENCHADAAFIAKAANNHDKLVEALGELVGDLDCLIAESEGVAGLHMNGEVAPWGDLTEGGKYEEWLASLEHAREALAALKEEQKAAESR